MRICYVSSNLKVIFRKQIPQKPDKSTTHNRRKTPSIPVIPGSKSCAWPFIFKRNERNSRRSCVSSKVPTILCPTPLGTSGFAIRGESSTSFFRMQSVRVFLACIHATVEEDQRGSSTRVRGNRQGSVYTGRISWPLCTVASGSPHFLWDFGDARRSRAANLDKTRERAKNREKMPHEETKAAAV